MIKIKEIDSTSDWTKSEKSLVANWIGPFNDKKEGGQLLGFNDKNEEGGLGLFEWIKWDDIEQFCS